jgi:hypothetical protein
MVVPVGGGGLFEVLFLQLATIKQNRIPTIPAVTVLFIKDVFIFKYLHASAKLL